MKLRSLYLLAPILSISSCISHHTDSLKQFEGNFPTVPYSELRIQQSHLFSDKKFPSSAIDDCEKIFYEGLSSDDEGIVIGTLQALAISHHEMSKNIFDKALNNRSLRVQLGALQALSLLGTKKASYSLYRALTSPYIIIRLQALWLLLDSSEENLFSQILALHSKLPPELYISLPELYAKEGSSDSIQQLKKMIYQEPDEVVSEIFSAIFHYRCLECEELLLSYTSHSPSVLENLAKVLQLFSSEKSLEKLRLLSIHPNRFVRAQAIVSRMVLGDITARSEAICEYKVGNEAILPSLYLSDQQIDEISFPRDPNITDLLYFLHNGSDEVTLSLKNIITSDLKEKGDLFFMKKYSPGGAIFWWEEKKNELVELSKDHLFLIKEQSLSFLENLLCMISTRLSKKNILILFESIAETKRVDLYPTLFTLLETLPDNDLKYFIEKFQNSLGSPYLRSYIALADMKRQGAFSASIMRSCFEVAKGSKGSLEESRTVIPFLYNEKKERELEQVKIVPSAHLYMAACQISLELGGDEAVKVIYDELDKGPKHLRPFIAAALLEIAR